MMKRIKSKYPLADIFNFVLGKLSVLKSISEPVTFYSRDNTLYLHCIMMLCYMKSI